MLRVCLNRPYSKMFSTNSTPSTVSAGHMKNFIISTNDYQAYKLASNNRVVSPNPVILLTRRNLLFTFKFPSFTFFIVFQQSISINFVVSKFEISLNKKMSQLKLSFAIFKLLKRYSFDSIKI